MLKQIAVVAGLLAAATLPASAQSPAKQPKHLIVNLPCGGYELWYQDNAVWGTHGACLTPNVFVGGVIAKMGGQKYFIVTGTYPISGIIVTTRLTLPVGGQGEWDEYATDGTSAPTHSHGTYTTS